MATRKKLGEEPEKKEEAGGVPLHVKYRPHALDQVLGQDEVVKSLKSMLKGKTSRPHSFLFMGPSGCGKTTFARILAKEFHCEPNNIIEADAASNNGIDDMREITKTLSYKGFGDTPNKLIILDECHALSKAAWQSLLKAVEEPPEHIYFAFCTTDAAKVPDTIRTRCQTYNLKPVKYDDLVDLLEFVCEEEKYDTPEEIVSLVARQADGSPRMALSMLSVVHDCEDKREAASLLEAPLENKEIIELARALVSGKGLEWERVCATLKGVAEPPESIRIIIVNYLAAVLMNAKKEGEVVRLLDMVAQFSKPINPTDKMAPILLAVGNIMFPA